MEQFFVGGGERAELPSSSNILLENYWAESWLRETGFQIMEMAPQIPPLLYLARHGHTLC